MHIKSITLFHGKRVVQIWLGSAYSLLRSKSNLGLTPFSTNCWIQFLVFFFSKLFIVYFMHLSLIFRPISHSLFQDFKFSLHVCFVLFVGFSFNFFSQNITLEDQCKNSPSRNVLAFTDVALAHTEATEVDINLVSLLSCQF